VSRRTVFYFCFLALGGAYLLGSLRLPRGTFEIPGSGLFPLLVAVFIVILSCILLVKSRNTSGAQLDATESFPMGADLRRVVTVALALFLYAVFLKFLGYLVCTTGLMATVLRLLGLRSWGKVAVVAILTGVLSYGLFVFILDVPLPRGEVFP
jgi:putative tricarboxylic transport membrane protein